MKTDNVRLDRVSGSAQLHASECSNIPGSNADEVFVGTIEETPKYGSSFSAMSCRRAE
jgi:hypothetical protein